MDFSNDDFYQFERNSEILMRFVMERTGCPDLSALTEEKLSVVKSEDLPRLILSFISVLGDGINASRSAAATIEKLKADNISKDCRVTKLQEELNVSKSEGLSKSVLRGIYTDVVREEERKKNVILFGISENEEDADLSTKIEAVLESACGENKPQVKRFCRVGKGRSGANRPVKVCFDSRDAAQITVNHAKELKKSGQYNQVFIAPDRSPEERTERRKLVGLLRKRIKDEPGKFHYIRKGEVCSREHNRANPRNELLPNPRQQDVIEHKSSSTENVQQVPPDIAERLSSLTSSLVESMNYITSVNENMAEKIDRYTATHK